MRAVVPLKEHITVAVADADSIPDTCAPGFLRSRMAYFNYSFDIIAAAVFPYEGNREYPPVFQMNLVDIDVSLVAVIHVQLIIDSIVHSYPPYNYSAVCMSRAVLLRQY